MSEGGGKPLFPEDFGYLGTGTNRDAPLPEVSREVLLSQAEKQLAQAKVLLRQKLEREMELLRRTEHALPAPSGIFRGEPKEDALPVVCRMLLSWEELQEESLPVFFALHAVEKQLTELRVAGVRIRSGSGGEPAGGTAENECPETEASRGKAASPECREAALSTAFARVSAAAREDAGSLSAYLRREVGAAADLSGEGKQCRLQTVFLRCGEVRNRLERLLQEL